ncbi:hypothetical protein PTSG_04474 [Salpingoeca rosetta]|uniref:Uncharacterized protein n=1 Tax=Salpingoeca rosetta (strain ATCC 50818 / BSB-021) TaxID=946362 RepID=F2U8N7_SALR5|nr:uncharacterized protein PTSG_04474 [Salpingoeca rosetta]EGD72745.1 hypothetical protein PTSG_04474 [Salpingoeca rosetta]|eukprot:XP_004994568.1 hypothetical protein PTSG_04474 [Salpingoeca rosetta]
MTTKMADRNSKSRSSGSRGGSGGGSGGGSRLGSSQGRKDDPELMLEKGDYEALMAFAKHVRVPALDRSIVKPVCVDDLEVKDEEDVAKQASKEGVHKSGKTGRTKRDDVVVEEEEAEEEAEVEEDIAVTDSPQGRRRGEDAKYPASRKPHQSRRGEAAHADDDEDDAVHSEVEEEIFEDDIPETVLSP